MCEKKCEILDLFDNSNVRKLKRQLIDFVTKNKKKPLDSF